MKAAYRHAASAVKPRLQAYPGKVEYFGATTERVDPTRVSAKNTKAQGVTSRITAIRGLNVLAPVCHNIAAMAESPIGPTIGSPTCQNIHCFIRLSVCPPMT